MEKYQHVQKYQIKYCEVDFKDELKLSSALSYLEEVACLSAEELGFGYDYVKAKGYAFMVSNICLEFLRPVCLGDLLTVKTWPLPPTYAIFGREYQMLLPSGEVCVNASSRWCLINVSTGKILQSKAIDNQDYSTYNTDKVLQNVAWKIPSFAIEDGELKFSLKIAYSEYDHNMHVNNTKYADYCMNCFSVEEHSNMRVERFLISYVKQCKEGETISFYRKQISQKEYLVQGMNENGELVVQTQIRFA
jgi:acyl-ACP thioesterase